MLEFYQEATKILVTKVKARSMRMVLKGSELPQIIDKFAENCEHLHKLVGSVIGDNTNYIKDTAIDQRGEFSSTPWSLCTTLIDSQSTCYWGARSGTAKTNSMLNCKTLELMEPANFYCKPSSSASGVISPCLRSCSFLAIWALESQLLCHGLFTIWSKRTSPRFRIRRCVGTIADIPRPTASARLYVFYSCRFSNR